MVRGAAIFVVLALAVAVAACGDSGPSEAEKARAAKEQREREKKKREREKAAALAEQCERDMKPLLTALQETNSRLSVGLNYEAYTTAVADVKVVYDQVPFAGAEVDQLDCLSEVGLPLEKAFNQYAKASTIWDECFADVYCENESIDPELQKHWSRATVLIEQAKNGLDDLTKP